MRPIFWSVSALDDLDRMIAYMATDGPTAARAVADRIEAAASHRGDMAIGRKGRVAGTFEKPVSGLPFVIAYAIEQGDDGRERIVVLRVIHGARNWPPDEWPAE